MARRTVKVEIPEGKPEDLISLAKSITERYTQDVQNNPLRLLPMEEFVHKQVAASEKRKEAKRLLDQGQSSLSEAEKIMGISAGQSRQTEGTLLYHLTAIRDQLLLAFRGNEEKLRDYGFKVTVSEAKAPNRKNKE